MKRYLTPTAFIVLALPFAAFAREQAKPAKPQTKQSKTRDAGLVKSREQTLLARVTVYWARGGSGSDRYTRQHKTATGVRLRSGHCAVDPRRIPYGSQVVLPDGRLMAVDTGTAVKNRKAARLSGRTKEERNAPVVDRFFETKKQALAWEKSHPPFMTVKVVLPANRKPGMQMQRLAKESTYPKAIPVTSTPATVAAAPTSTKYPKAILVAKKENSTKLAKR